MTYKLAKQLKEAGFPQKGNGKFVVMEGADLLQSEAQVYKPTLSELIDVCGDGFSSLIRYVDKFIVNSSDAKIKPIISKTPKEAFAKLWLELNK